MNAEFEDNKRKVLAVYPDAIFYRGFGGCNSVLLDQKQRPWNPISAENHDGDAAAAWADAASRLPSAPSKAADMKHPNAAHDPWPDFDAWRAEHGTNDFAENVARAAWNAAIAAVKEGR